MNHLQVPLHFFCHGSATPLPQRRRLRAGPLSLCLDVGDLRYLKFGDREVIRRIYAAVREKNWGTVPAAISSVESEISKDSFHIRYLSTHLQDDVHFVWRGEITGQADGGICFGFEGEARSSFLKNRIGFCVLHPIRECAGASCRVRYSDGTCKELVLPHFIAADQPMKDLHDLAGIAHEVMPGIWAELEFEGDLFESEDQRNWIDASFKTYCTPLREPRPSWIHLGTRVRQVIRLKLVDSHREGSASDIKPLAPSIRTSPIATASSSVGIDVTVSDSTMPLPEIGLGAPTHNGSMHETEVMRLRALSLDHIRIDVRLWEARWRDDLERAEGIAAELNAKVELALHLDADPDRGLKQAIPFLQTKSTCLRRLLLFQRGQPSTTVETWTAFREACGEDMKGVSIGVGTDADFYQLISKPPPADADCIAWSMNPQSHAFDCASVAETPEAAGQQIVSARQYFPGKPLAVSPITLRPRFNAVATGPEPAVRATELPPQADARQLSLFGAGWTIAMVSALAGAGVDSLTFYETTGWRGLMETQAGSNLPEKFPSIPGAVFPLYHVFADLGEFARGQWLQSASSDALAVTTLAMRNDRRHRLLLANLTDETQEVRLKSPLVLTHFRRLDVGNANEAAMRPEAFRQSWSPWRPGPIVLPPFAVFGLANAP